MRVWSDTMRENKAAKIGRREGNRTHQETQALFGSFAFSHVAQVCDPEGTDLSNRDDILQQLCNYRVLKKQRNNRSAKS